MLGSGDPTPDDVRLVALLVVLVILLGIGAVTAGSWAPGTAAWVRHGAVLLGLGATAAVILRTPTTNGIVGAGRMLTIWPALAATVLAYLVWSWRAGRL
jgi:hypothetical protein